MTGQSTTQYSIEFLAAMARIHERQETWHRTARDTSEASLSPSTSASSSDTSPGTSSRALKDSGSPHRARNSRTKARADGKAARKKVAKACLACQRSHLTCDECRPCTRCTKKGIGEQCVEGVRKKAKYLLEGDERAPSTAPIATGPSIISNQAPSFPSASPPNLTYVPPPLPVQTMPIVTIPQQPIDPLRVPDNIWLTAPLPEAQAAPVDLGDWGLQPTDPFNFSSSAAANLEYEMFDSLFGPMSPSFPLGDLTSSSATDGSTPTLWTNFGLPDVSSTAPDQTVAPSVSMQPTMSTDLSPQDIWTAGTWAQAPVYNEVPQLTGVNTIDLNGSEPITTIGPTLPIKLTAEGVYNTVVTPYDYTEGYHFLMQYLTQNFEKPDILRVVRALAAFRPSLIALQMPMSEEDEVFLERSFQRTLIELEKLISYSATPTIVWRRTGEVCYAAPKFCQLVGRTEDELVGSKTYIYQLFSKASTIQYWENFAVHAFENTTQNFFQATTLVNAKGVEVPSACCYTIRRDVFDLPSVVIGQFLPIPAEATA